MPAEVGEIKRGLALGKAEKGSKLTTQRTEVFNDVGVGGTHR